MAMSVADKPVVQPTPRSPQQQLAMGSLLGAVYVLLSLWVIFAGIPTLWDLLTYHQNPELRLLNDFLSEALLLLLVLAIAVVLGYGAYRLVALQPRKGLRAGILVAAAELALIVLIGFGVGRMLQRADFGPELGWTVIAVLMGVLLAGAFYIFVTPGWGAMLEGLEEQGWFTALPYKGNQGVRIRRATVLGALVLGFSGVITMVSHRSFGSDRVEANDWYLTVPFTTRTVNVDRMVEKARNQAPLTVDEQALLAELGGADQLDQIAANHGGRIYTYSRTLPLMYKLHIVLPVVCGLLILWFSYRLVNVPTFSDFLIATEAEMNKVSWTTRRRLFQDTIVVLVTVLLMTVFLFFIDILWIKVLSGVGVLQVDVKAQLQKQQEKSQW
jgi:preprotein translocase SecE subunit